MSAKRTGSWLTATTLAFGLTAVLARRWLPAAMERMMGYARRPGRVRHPVLIINRWSGDGKSDRIGLAQEASRLGVEVIMLERGDDLTQLAGEAIDEGADAIGMAGGDGSLGMVAAVAIERGVPFFCVPTGTRNHFALDLGLDRDEPLEALGALQRGDELAVDYATANGRVFVNNVSLGIYGVAVHMDGYREAKAETLRTVMREMAADPGAQPKIRFDSPDGHSHESAALLLVSNNRYIFTGPPDFGRRTGLEAGVLGVGAVTANPTSTNLLAVSLADLAGFREWNSTTMRVESDTPIQAGVDGEAITFHSPLDLSIAPGGLRVLVPRGTTPGYVALGEAVAVGLLDLVSLGGRNVGDDG